jgi:predicted nucleic-acid-binding Zn-ribbon protein
MVNMGNISPEQMQKIIQKLEQLGAVRPCPRCGNPTFTIMDGFLNQTVQQTLTNLNIGGPSIPSIVVVCNKCGYMSQHSLGVLGFLTPQGELKIE